MTPDSRFDVVVADLLAVERAGADGVVWSLPRGADLNANLVHLAPGGAIGSHTNDEVDVLLVGASGQGVVTVDGEQHEFRGGVIVAVPKHHVRSVAARDDHELLYVTVHVARAGLQLSG
jgi:quercetin dioxygenase-like cupin family protein